MEISNDAPTENQRYLSAVSHVAPILPMGMVITLIIFLVYASKSAFVSRHSRQALAWQVLMLLASVVTTVIYLPIYLNSFFQMMQSTTNTPRGGPPPDAFMALFGMQFVFMGLFFLIFGVFLVIGAVQAYRALKGGESRYPIVSRVLERLLKA